MKQLNWKMVNRMNDDDEVQYLEDLVGKKVKVLEIRQDTYSCDIVIEISSVKKVMKFCGDGDYRVDAWLSDNEE